jgi:hypothetical protein
VLYDGRPEDVSPRDHPASRRRASPYQVVLPDRLKVSSRHQPRGAAVSTRSYSDLLLAAAQITDTAVPAIGTKGSPDLPSNCSSLRDLDCTHSNYETQKSPVSVFIVT